MTTSDTTPARQLIGECDGCGGHHQATYHHEGAHGEGPIYIVTCPDDHLATFVTTEALNADPCGCCQRRPAGHGHFALYCQPCSEQSYTGCTHE